MTLTLAVLASIYPAWKAASSIRFKPCAASEIDDGTRLELSGVSRHYREGEARLDILVNVDFVMEPGQTVALIAPSGAGKSTLLHIAGLLEHPDAGEIKIHNAPTSTMSDDARTKLRRNSIGFVYQFHHLLPEFTALENVVLPQTINGLGKVEAADARGKCWIICVLARAPRIDQASSPAANNSGSP